MTWIYDNDGRHWVDVPVPKRRKSPRGIRFADVKVGDQLVVQQQTWSRRDTVMQIFYVVTHIWFDPVKGYRSDGTEDREAGVLVAIQRISERGELMGRPWSYTRRGLASQQFHYAKIDYIALCKARAEALKDGAVVGIGKGDIIRRRPKTPGRPL